MCVHNTYIYFMHIRTVVQVVVNVCIASHTSHSWALYLAGSLVILVFGMYLLRINTCIIK